MDWSTIKQCCKVGVAVGLAYLLTYGERSHYALYAVLTAALVVGENLGDDLNLSIVRLVGTLIGAGVGVAALYIGGINLVSIVVAIFVAGLLSKLIKLEQVNRVAFAVCVVTLLLHPESRTAYGFYRFINTVIGAVIGFGVSLVLWPVRAGQAAAQSIDKLVELSAGILSQIGSAQPARLDLGTSVEMQQLIKVFKVVRDVHSEGRVLKGKDAAIGERAILGGQVCLGSLAVAAACARLAVYPAVNPYLKAVAACTEVLAKRAQYLVHPSPMPEAWTLQPRLYPEVPTTLAETELTPGLQLLMSGVVMELRVLDAALSLLERLRTVATNSTVIGSAR